MKTSSNLTKQAKEYYESHTLEVTFGTFYNKVRLGIPFHEAGKKITVLRGEASHETEEISRYKRYRRAHLDIQKRNSLLHELKPVWEEFRSGVIDQRAYENKSQELHNRFGLIAI